MAGRTVSQHGFLAGDKDFRIQTYRFPEPAQDGPGLFYRENVYDTLPSLPDIEGASARGYRPEAQQRSAVRAWLKNRSHRGHKADFLASSPTRHLGGYIVSARAVFQ